MAGVESNGVGQVFALDQPRHQSLVAGLVHGHGRSIEEGDQGNFPHRNDLGPGQGGKKKGQDHHDGLGNKQQPALVDPVSDNPPKSVKKRNGMEPAKPTTPARRRSWR